MRLNLGSGGRRDSGWTHVDRAGNVDVIHDLTDLPLPFEDESCEGAAAHHVLDLLTAPQIRALLADIHRCLQPGATLRISTADIHSAIRHALDRDAAWFPEPKETLEESLGWYVTQGGARKTLLTITRLRCELRSAGFAHSFLIEAGCTLGPGWLTELDDRENESVFVEAVK